MKNAQAKTMHFSQEFSANLYRRNIKLSKLVRDLQIEKRILILKLQESEEEVAQLKSCIDQISERLG